MRVEHCSVSRQRYSPDDNTHVRCLQPCYDRYHATNVSLMTRGYPRKVRYVVYRYIGEIYQPSRE